MTSPVDTLKADLARVMALLVKSDAGRWILATSCSWRRIVTEDGRAVIVPTTQRSDGHPDLDCGQDFANAEAAVAAVNFLREHGPAIAALGGGEARAWEVQFGDGSGFLAFTEEEADDAIAEAASGGTKRPLYTTPRIPDGWPAGVLARLLGLALDAVIAHLSAARDATINPSPIDSKLIGAPGDEGRGDGSGVTGVAKIEDGATYTRMYRPDELQITPPAAPREE